MSLPVHDRLIVWWNSRVARELTIDLGGAMHFVYAPEWLVDAAAPPLSQALPCRVASPNFVTRCLIENVTQDGIWSSDELAAGEIS